MNKYIIALINNLPTITCVIGAILLAVYGIDGWGWFLFIALLV